MTFRKTLSVALGTLLLAATLALVTTRSLDAESSGLASVRIVSPLPVPITGSTTVSGTVAATQGSPWNVTVNNPQPLRVTAPVIQPVQFRSDAFTVNQNSLAYVVPSGKRLVVEHLASLVGVDSGATVIYMGLSVAPDPSNPGTTSSGQFIFPTFTSPSSNPGQVLAGASQPVRLYVEAGQGLVTTTFVIGSVGNQGSAGFTITAYLVDAP